MAIFCPFLFKRKQNEDHRIYVMSVPCLVVDDDRVTFGKKNIQQLLEFLG